MSLLCCRDFPSFSEGLSLRRSERERVMTANINFPSFSEGLSLRPECSLTRHGLRLRFPFLFGGTFIEAVRHSVAPLDAYDFPSFSEGLSLRRAGIVSKTRPPGDFPSFSEGLSLRLHWLRRTVQDPWISLPFRRDFH